MNSSFAGYLGWEQRLFAPCKGIQDNPGFWIPRSGSPIPIVSGIPDILELHSGFQSPGSEFHKQNFQFSSYHEQKYSRDSGFGFSCIARALGSWQIRLLFPPRKGGGGLRTHGNSWWGYAARFSKSWPYFRPKNVIFHTRFQTWPLGRIYFIIT